MACLIQFFHPKQDSFIHVFKENLLKLAALLNDSIVPGDVHIACDPWQADKLNTYFVAMGSFIELTDALKTSKYITKWRNSHVSCTLKPRPEPKPDPTQARPWGNKTGSGLAGEISEAQFCSSFDIIIVKAS
ncbi:hypothetical protein K438DRAFT_1760442 [Mycena galopus ATCC 62051]|nr:hypothetical protein K438DRAFT_1760442 [Mycena galopus ATCC 62051]